MTKGEVSLLEEAGYSKKAIKLYSNKINVGVMENFDVAQAYTDPCGDMIKIYLKISESDVIEDATSQYLGYPASAACGSMLTQIIKGKTLEVAS